MTKKPFVSFKELINHELPSETIKLTHEGYKLDCSSGDSLKRYCNLNDLKSADYLFQNKGKVFIVEFSDIVAQQTKLLEKVEHVKKSDLDKNVKKDVCKNYLREVVQEMKEKFKDTHTIYTTLPTYFDDLEEEFKSHYDKCLLIVSDKALTDGTMEKSKQITLARFLSGLGAQITNAIPDYINTKVTVSTIGEFSK
ncbi:hypothetical protein O1B20_000159 [Vibrio cholerae]|nr:hypothetical protein [Vibrio cholerae]